MDLGELLGQLLQQQYAQQGTQDIAQDSMYQGRMPSSVWENSAFPQMVNAGMPVAEESRYTTVRDMAPTDYVNQLIVKPQQYYAENSQPGYNAYHGSSPGPTRLAARTSMSPWGVNGSFYGRKRTP